MKETHYFGPFWQRELTEQDIGKYQRLFARPPGKKAGEWTPSYMFDPWVAPLLRLAAPDAKIFVILRNPIDRLLSAVAYAREQGEELGETVVFGASLADCTEPNSAI